MQKVVAIKQPAARLVSRNVRIAAKRTSVRLEMRMWEALQEIARENACSIHDVCKVVHDNKGEGDSFSAALRAFVLQYYRNYTDARQLLDSFKLAATAR